MTPFYSDDWLTLYGGDCRTVLSELPADSVDCVVTSPPYWGLRDYGTATWEGGDAECDHKQEKPLHEDRTSTLGVPANGGPRRIGENNTTVVSKGVFRDICGKCGAVRIDSQLGLERTPEEYVANMVAVFAEVRRVLKPSGTCWLNLGDSYASGTIGRNDDDTIPRPKGGHRIGTSSPGVQGTRPRPEGMKPKDLVGIPWRVAFALQADGWYLRSDIIWSKPNPMPESVTDRPTKSHEYLFLLTKSPRYYFDADAVREAYSEKTWFYDHVEPTKYARANGGVGNGGPTSTLGVEAANRHGGRNIRSVWNIATRPYPGAHFAVFPPELPERCIKAGSSEKGVCPECGAPWERVVERAKGPEVAPSSLDRYGTGEAGVHRKVGGQYQKWLDANPPQTTGWRPSCPHDWTSDEREHRKHRLHLTNPQPAVVLDPFGGSGTVGMVANRLSRRAILIDLNPEYLKQQMRRNAQTPLGLTEGDAA